ncbi:type VI secretion system protein TssA [Paraburkholderia sp. SG-MS1]|uniref:type VI secretion system protein TssA n=1 Tax=Paraburkholderia sp. SG-MS1 TaxID=2023741 RepID=UPI001EEC8DEA|nr:type VI secretion system protein TssA [Paraburkholderia sp. SG-MS1]
MRELDLQSEPAGSRLAETEGIAVEFIDHPDWSKWFDGLTDASPCGDDLEYDPSFRALEAAAHGRPEAEYGTTLVPAVPPDWQAADALCVDLLARTRDLRVVVYLIRARLAVEGIVALADGLALVLGLLDTQWTHVHPQLDAADADDPTARINALAALADNAGLVEQILNAPLVPQLHSASAWITLKRWLAVNDEPTAGEANDAATQAEIDASVAAAADRAASLSRSFRAASAHAERIEATLVERVGHGRSLDLSVLRTTLRRAQALLDACQDRQGLGGAHLQDAAGMDAAPLMLTPVSTRADVIATLDRLCDYYARHEPSSPVPLLLGRAKGLVDKTFDTAAGRAKNRHVAIVILAPGAAS